MAVILGLILSFNEVINTSNSKEIFLLTELEEKKLNFLFPKIDFCINKGHRKILGNSILTERLLFTEEYVKNYTNNLSFISTNVSSNVYVGVNCTLCIIELK